MSTSTDSEEDLLSNFIISPIELPNGAKSIKFGISGKNIPDEEIKFKNEVETTLHVITTIYKNQKEKFEESLYKLTSLTQVGLVGKNRNINVATHALKNLQHEILDREVGNIKNNQLTSFFKYCSVFTIVFIVLLIIFSTFLGDFFGINNNDKNFIKGILFLLVSIPFGTWMSMATRRINMSFEDLISVEEDHFNPSIRLFFISLLATTLGLLLDAGIINFEIGSFSASKFTEHPKEALLLGIIIGLSDKVLPMKIASHANNLLSSNK